MSTGRCPALSGHRCLSTQCVAPAEIFSTAAAHLTVHLPCQRCLRRLARPDEIDKEMILSCDRQLGHTLCDYCEGSNSKCLSVGLALSCTSLGPR